jgi:hypothetical protein
MSPDHPIADVDRTSHRIELGSRPDRDDASDAFMAQDEWQFDGQDASVRTAIVMDVASAERRRRHRHD